MFKAWDQPLSLQKNKGSNKQTKHVLFLDDVRLDDLKQSKPKNFLLKFKADKIPAFKWGDGHGATSSSGVVLRFTLTPVW